jgi:hypothetical protein
MNTFPILRIALVALVFSFMGAGQSTSNTFTSIDFPGSASTAGDASIWIRLNEQKEIVGGYRDSNGVGHGFLLRGGKFISFDAPGAIYTELNAINAPGDIVGDKCSRSTDFGERSRFQCGRRREEIPLPLDCLRSAG